MEDGVMQIDTKRHRPAPPKLRKNQRLDKRWGDKYYVAVKEAVFTLRENPHMPAKIPLSLQEHANDCQPSYVCEQCDDCFCFLSSYEAHNSRRSWILGYWCQDCFFIECPHAPNGLPSCFDCQAIHRQRTTSLRAKGLKKGRKMGSIKIFYNQCQFFAHLRRHDTVIVDMADVMLMPVPMDVDRKSYAELERACAIIMERMFLTRTHIMDWFKSHGLSDDWWHSLGSGQRNHRRTLEKLLAATGTNRRHKTPIKHPLRQQTTIANNATSLRAPSAVLPSGACLSKSPSSVSATIESVVAQSKWTETDPLAHGKIPEMLARPSIETEMIEHDDDPCITTDIAFVDCGPVAKTYPSDLAIVLPSKDNIMLIPNGNNNSSSLANPGTQSMITEMPSISKLGQANHLVHTNTSCVVPQISQHLFEPKISVRKFATELLKTAPNIASQIRYSKMIKHPPQALRKLAPALSIRPSNVNRPRSSVIEIAKPVETSKKALTQASLSSLGSKILTVQSPKNTEFSKIISQLPPDAINGKKIVFIGQDAERFSVVPKNEITSSSLGMIKIQSETERGTNIQPFPTKIVPIPVSNTESEQSAKATSERAKKNPKPDIVRPQMYLDGQVIYQNGKKFIIRQARKAVPESNICTDINNLKLQTIPKRVNLSTFLSSSVPPSCISKIPMSADTGVGKTVLSTTPCSLASCSTSPSLSSTPSPSLSPSLSTFEDPLSLKEKSEIKRKRNSSENMEISADSMKHPESQSLCANAVDGVEYLSIKKNAAGKSYVDFSKSNKELTWTQIVIDCKQQMRANFRILGAERIRQQIDHIREINAEYSRIVGVTDDERISGNLQAIKDLENILNEEPACSAEDKDSDRGSNVNDIEEILSKLQESRERPSICPTCNRSTKSESHILEFSKGSGSSPGCSSCNIYVCHICGIYQGNISRFRAHLNLHAKKEPFNCPECFRKFSSFHRLETHVWTTCFHLLARKWFKCRVCLVEGFPNMESVTKHFVLAHTKFKVACPECGVLFQSKTAFEDHKEECRPIVNNQLPPVNLMICDIGSCVIRFENFRSHMDHHIGVINMTYYKCPFCPLLIRAIRQGREKIRSHLYNQHSERLSELGSSGNIYLGSFKRLLASHENSQNYFNRHMPDASTSILYPSDQDEEIGKVDGSSAISESVRSNAGAIDADNKANNSQVDGESSSDNLDASSSKQTPRVDVECSVSSINIGSTKSDKSTDLKSESLEIETAMQAVDSCDNVITEYSSSPKIFDVRSVTPDSYAELDSETKEQIEVTTKGNHRSQTVSGVAKEEVSEDFTETKVLERRDKIAVSEGPMKDSLVLKMGDQLLPMKLPQLIIINQAEATMNLTEILQSTLTAPNTFVNLSDLTNSYQRTPTRSALEAGSKSTDKDIPKTNELSEPVIRTTYTLAAGSPDPEKNEKIKPDLMSITKLPRSIEVWPKQSGVSSKQLPPLPFLKSETSCIRNMTTGIVESQTHISDSHAQFTYLPQNTTKTLDNCEESAEDPLLLWNIPKPPPLTRIPQHILAVSQTNMEVGEKEAEEIKVTSPRSVVKIRQRHKQPWRIALNAPIHTMESPVKYRCHLCDEPINTSWSVLQNHFNSRHSQSYKLSIITPRLLRMSSDFINDGYKEVLGTKKRKSDASVPMCKRRKRWKPRKHTEQHSLGGGLCVEQESLQDGEGNFICKKCDEQCNDILSLRTHIGINHRIKDHYLVCLECGENFVVEPSLQMHLKAFHNVRDPSTYMAQNTGYASKIKDTVEDESNTGIANQCHVCMAVFEDKLAVDKHLRVHGMAFLNRKRIEAQMAARNPDKRSKIDKPDDSLGVPVQKNEKLEHNKLGRVEPVNETARES